VASYAVAKVVVAGEPGVDTSSLLCALAGLPDEAGEATPTWPAIPVARSIVQLPDGCLQRRELYAWGLDLREPDGLLAPIWLADAAGAVVLVDPARLDDHAPPLAGRADVLGPAIGAACPGLLVSVGEGAHAPDADRMEALREEHGFSSCLILDGDREEDLRRLSDAMWELVPWQSLPNASAPWCWPELRAFLLARARGAEALVPWTTLRRELQDHHAPAEVSVEDLRAALAAARLEGLAWPLPFGGLVLLRPELLQRHGAALLRQVLNQAEGLGAVPEASVLQGQQDVTPGGPLGGRDEERLLLHAVVELLVARGIALRQEGWLVFPALVGAGRPHRPVPPRTELEYELTGSREHAFAGLVVRLATSGAFRLRALWRDAADFEGGLGGVCGVVLRRCDGPDVAVGVRFDETVSAETKVLFDGMVGAHLRHWAPTGSLRRERIRFCPGCGRRVTREAVRAAEQAGRASVACLSCDTVLPLRDSLGEHLEPSTAPGGYGVHVLHDPADAREVGRLARALRRRRILAHLNWELLPPGRWFAAATAGALPALRAVAVVLGPEESDRWEAHEVRALVDETVRCSLPVVPVLLPGVKAIPRSLAFLEHFALVSLGPKGGDGRAFDELAQAIRGTTSVSATGETPRPRAQTAARAQQEKLDLWRDLTARSAHRIGNQLFAARGELRLLEAGLSEERRSGTGRVAACLDRIRGIVEEYRRYRRDTPLNRSPTSIGDLVATVADQFRAQAGARTLTTDLSDDLPVCLLDPVLLGDALGELLDNALHHVGDDGQVSVSAALEGEGDAAELRIVVTDNGPGVPAGSKERILEPFVGERPAGSGLGLAIVQSVVERHGGRIAEVGTYGEGAVFEIRIPVEPMTGELR